MTLTLSSSDKYGVVTVVNPDGSFNRQYRITGAELSALQKSANGIPPGCTEKEWTTGLAVCAGKAFDVGDVSSQSDGSLIVKFGERVVNGVIVEDAGIVKPGDWFGVPPAVTVTGPVTLPSKLTAPITIAGGVATVNVVVG